MGGTWWFVVEVKLTNNECYSMLDKKWEVYLYSQFILDLLLVCGIVFIILHKPSSLFSLLLAAWHVQYSECYIIITKYCVALQPPTCQEVKMTGWFSGCLSGYLAQSSTKILKSNSKSNVEQTYMNLSVKLKYFVSCIIFEDWLHSNWILPMIISWIIFSNWIDLHSTLPEINI